VYGCAIDYDGAQYINGKQNKAYLVVGHIVSRYDARRMGWTDAMINARSNTRPECTACSNKSGARLGQKVQSSRSQLRFGATDAHRW
jgi:hypothetical protein